MGAGEAGLPDDELRGWWSRCLWSGAPPLCGLCALGCLFAATNFRISAFYFQVLNFASSVCLRLSGLFSKRTQSLHASVLQNPCTSVQFVSVLCLFDAELRLRGLRVGADHRRSRSKTHPIRVNSESIPPNPTQTKFARHEKSPATAPHAFISAFEISAFCPRSPQVRPSPTLQLKIQPKNGWSIPETNVNTTESGRHPDDERGMVASDRIFILNFHSWLSPRVG